MAIRAPWGVRLRVICEAVRSVNCLRELCQASRRRHMMMHSSYSEENE
jgi:hypothetical protein